MPAKIQIKEVTRARWKDLEALFEARGGPKYCWCMAWRAVGPETKRTDAKSRKGFLKRRVDAGIPVGLLAYRDGQPVGWCSVAPKASYRKLDDLEPAVDPEKTWAIACFYVQRDARGDGLAGSLLAEAIKHARRKKAKLIEAYPVDEDSPSYRFMGFVPVFEERGFEEAGLAGTRRHVMRLAL